MQYQLNETSISVNIQLLSANHVYKRTFSFCNIFFQPNGGQCSDLTHSEVCTEVCALGSVLNYNVNIF